MAGKRVWPSIAVPPGETLAEEIQSRGLSQSELARRMGRPVQVINEIIRGKKAITATTALGLEDVLGVSAEFWLRLEAGFQLSAARLARRPRVRRSSAQVRHAN
jgi:addiction module HigA family antidote